MLASCLICDSHSWHSLPNPSDTCSVTTSGHKVGRLLNKLQCRHCGFVQIQPENMSSENFYKEEYSTYYERVAAKTFDDPRYRHLAQWMFEAVSPLKPHSILDVGCGRGWEMEKVGQLFPDAEIMGVEPSLQNSRIGADRGLKIIAGTLEASAASLPKFDLIYSTNVLQHVQAPKDFLAIQKSLLNEDGVVVIKCPDSSRPGNEMLYYDQKCSFAPVHLKLLAQKVGFENLSWRKPPATDSLLDKQLIVLGRNKGLPNLPFDIAPTFDVEENIRLRVKYVESWRMLDDYLCSQIPIGGKVYNFGASMWSYNLRAYCPQYWSQVERCLVDGFEGRFMDKEVIPFDLGLFEPGDVIVLGTNPEGQDNLKKRFVEDNIRVIAWNHIISS